MHEVVIFRHVANEGPGYIAKYLAERRIPHRLVCIDRGDPYPESIVGISGLIFMGGPMSVNDKLPWIRRALKLIQRGAHAGLPMLGHCLGAQLISKALGGTVTRNPVREIGWLPVAPAWLDGLPHEFEVFHWHGETCSVPDNAARILASRDCPNQGFVLANILGLQCHIEVTAPMVRNWVQAYAPDLREPSASVQTPEEITRSLDARTQNLQRIADRLYDRWIRGLT